MKEAIKMVKNDKKTRNKGEKDVNDVSLHNSSKIDKKKKRKLKKWVLIVILIIFLIGVIISGIGLICFSIIDISASFLPL